MAETISFKVPARPETSILVMDQFLGVDLTNHPTNISPAMSPNAPNMIRDVPGKVRKAMGYEGFETYPDKINGAHYRRDGAGIIHAGTKLYERLLYNEELQTGGTLSGLEITYDRAAEITTQGKNGCIKNVTVYGKTTQSGTGDPSPTNIRPITTVGDSGSITISAGTPHEVTVLPLCDGDTLETNVLSGEEYKQREYHTKKKITFNGSENWAHAVWGPPDYTWGNIDHARFQLILEQAPVFNTAPICNCFKGYIYSNIAGEGVMIGGSPTINVVIQKDRLSTIDAPGFKTWLASNNITIVYELATPTETLTTPLAIENANGEFTITASGDVSAVIYAAKEMYSGVNDVISSSWQFDDKVIIVDGKELLLWEDTIEPASNTATIPTVFIAKPPDGQGGTKLDPLNLIQPKYTETFAGTASATVYQLDFAPLDTGSEVKVELLQSDGSWLTKTETTHFNVNRTTGTITFVTAPGVSPLTGEDNVRITAKRTVQEYIDRINKCNFGILFGVNGAADRLFLSGNPDMPNYDWYSAMNDPTYFGDLSYSVLGQAASAIVGYSVINDRLAAHKDSMEAERNVVLRSGDLVDNEPAFRIVNTLQGAGAIARNSFAYLATEPLFLTSLGVYAITPQDVTGERYAQGRSYYLNGELLKESGLENAFAIAYKDMYWLCVNNKAYILDGMQPLTQAQGMPYSTRQYVGFLRTNWPARILWEQDKRLWFGSAAGKLYRMYDDTENPLSYNDDGKPIIARWETQDISGKLFYKNKTFKYLALRLATAAATSVTISAMKKGIWSTIKEDDTSARYFTWSKMTWSKFTWSNDLTPKLIRSRARVRKTDKARFAFENNALNEPFGIFNLAFEYREGGNAK